MSGKCVQETVRVVRVGCTAVPITIIYDVIGTTVQPTFTTLTETEPKPIFIT